MFITSVALLGQLFHSCMHISTIGRFCNVVAKLHAVFGVQLRKTVVKIN